MQRREKLTHLPYFLCRTVAALDHREQPIFSPIHALLNRSYNTNIMFKNAVSRFVFFSAICWQPEFNHIQGCSQDFSRGTQKHLLPQTFFYKKKWFFYGLLDIVFDWQSHATST